MFFIIMRRMRLRLVSFLDAGLFSFVPKRVMKRI